VDDKVNPNPVVTGARVKVVPRTMNATEWQIEGHAGVHLWAYDWLLGNDFQYVEVYIEDGQDANGVHRTFFGTFDVSSTIFGQEWKFGPQPAMGTEATLTVRRSGSGQFAAEFSQGLASGVKFWNNHRDTLVQQESGVEVTNPCDRVDRSYYAQIQWRKQSDSTWVGVTEQNLNRYTVPSGNPVIQGIAWCGANTRYRVWINSAIGTAGCN
jgi:hypothetical protein